MLMVFLLMELGRSLYFDRAEWRHVFLLLAIGKTHFNMNFVILINVIGQWPCSPAGATCTGSSS